MQEDSQGTTGQERSDSDLLVPVWSRPLPSCKAGTWPKTSRVGQQIPQKPLQEVLHGKASSPSSPLRGIPPKVILKDVPGYLRSSSVLWNLSQTLTPLSLCLLKFFASGFWFGTEKYRNTEEEKLCKLHPNAGCSQVQPHFLCRLCTLLCFYIILESFQSPPQGPSSVRPQIANKCRLSQLYTMSVIKLTNFVELKMQFPQPGLFKPLNLGSLKTF